MKALVLSLACLIAASAVASTTFTAPDGAKIVYTPPPATTAPPVTTPPTTSGVAWVFHNGARTALWGGDYSYGSGSVSYTTKDATTGETVVGVTGDEAWQPFFTNSDFDTTGYHFVLISLKALTNSQQNWATGAESKGDIPIPGSTPGVKGFMQYCTPSTPVVGQWMSCKIPFSVYNIDKNPGIHVYKFGFQQMSSPVPGGVLTWEAKEYGISP